MSRPDVVVFDYGSGNLRSAQRALERAGADVTVTDDVAAAARATGLVVPGVGAFAACMAGLAAAGGHTLVTDRVARGAPVLGICVGAQVMFDAGDEHGVVTGGLGLLPGTVTRLSAERVPHMGWNTLDHDGLWLLDGVAPEERFYFVHSYAARPPIAGAEVATCDYGGPFVAVACRGPLSATQFHPEKSGRAGLALLSNWVRSL
ncbi:glutamine amidotransferase [Stackebrandtia albiflava]|uniref:Imidazole glycerol phosphate synthase subunit HisH n=1 Tax=Stackebrandtia albiflava TaxID=406432 RepID=A0A562VBP5_9ACTN|nr:imidazole glycerol phosphate synthase subunit HisH [Stackebrandtia albiflava]TWJ15299.1 glutamine amidotransferase [Stackebrandtia albiflava]